MTDPTPSEPPPLPKGAISPEPEVHEGGFCPEYVPNWKDRVQRWFFPEPPFNLWKFPKEAYNSDSGEIRATMVTKLDFWDLVRLIVSRRFEVEVSHLTQLAPGRVLTHAEFHVRPPKFADRKHDDPTQP